MNCCVNLLKLKALSLHTRDRMQLPFMTDQCDQMLKICKEFVRLQVSYDEYLCMKVLLLLSTGNSTLILPKAEQSFHFMYVCVCVLLLPYLLFNRLKHPEILKTVF